MLIALLALLGIPAWFIGLVVFSALHQRKAVLERDDIFWYREWTGEGWGRRKGVARWVSDALVRHQAFALVRTMVDAATIVEIGPVTGEPPNGLGNDVMEIRVTLMGRDAPLRLAVSAEMYDRWAGPAHLREGSRPAGAA